MTPIKDYVIGTTLLVVLGCFVYFIFTLVEVIYQLKRDFTSCMEMSHLY